ncbi:MAG: hypothetical protein R3F35_18080 [Myxococcota bacterium]
MLRSRLPSLLALLAGSAGALVLDGLPRAFCAAGAASAAFALVWLGATRGRGDTDRLGPRVTGVALTSLPAILLFGSILIVSRSDLQRRARFAPIAPTPPPEIHLIDDSASARACLESEPAKAYLEALHRRLREAWDARPTSGEGSGSVVLGFVLDDQGGIRLVRVIDASSDAYRELGNAALADAAPFGPLSGPLVCVTRLELRATLDRNDTR